MRPSDRKLPPVAVFASSLDDDPEREDRAVAAFLRRRVDGLILTTARRRPAYLAALESRGIPVVYIDREPADSDVDAVTVYCYQPAASGTSQCDDVTLTAAEPAGASIAQGPANANVMVGDSAHFEVRTGGDHAATVTWQRNAGSGWETLRASFNGFEQLVTGAWLAVNDVTQRGSEGWVVDRSPGTPAAAAAVSAGARGAAGAEAPDRRDETDTSQGATRDDGSGGAG